MTRAAGPRRFGIRARAALGFAATGCAVAVLFAAVTYGLARGYLVAQREKVVARQAFVNARLARAALRADRPDVVGFLDGVSGETGSNSLIRYEGRWFSTSVEMGADDVPRDLLRVVSARGNAATQRHRTDDGDLVLVTGVPLAAVDGLYFEVAKLTELEDTLSLLSRLVAVGAVIATAGAALVGAGAARRLVRPLAPIGVAAGRIAEGQLATRLDSPTDADLQPLVDAFNEMAATLEARIDREMRFSADVTHELRAPLAAIASATDVIARRGDQLPEEVVAAFEVLTEKLQTLQQTVLDLLEISQVDSGAAALRLEPIELRALVDRVLQLHGVDEEILAVAPEVPVSFTADRRRMSQALGNVVANASAYGGGLVRLAVARSDGRIRFVFDDRGPGVAPSEREAIFGRFARGDAGVRAGSASGTGLGLAIAAEHVRLHGGRIWVDDGAFGGARFVIEVPEMPC